MSTFAQKSASITTLHLIRQDEEKMRVMLGQASANQKIAVIIPCLATEYSLPGNRENFERILRELAQLKYLWRVIIGVDKGTHDDICLLQSLAAKARLDNVAIHWNDGPEFSALYEVLEGEGKALAIRGKGRNMYMGFGVALALGASSVCVLDGDIRTLSARQIERLIFPVSVLSYGFSKAYYARVHDDCFYGRVKRLFIDPLLLAMRRKFSSTQQEKFLQIVDYLLSFDYQLSGEFAINADILKQMRFATNWGVDLYCLIEARRKSPSICQVELTDKPFDHKHREVRPKDGTGLKQMALEIMHTLMTTLIVEEGLEISGQFLRDLAMTYQSMAEQLIKKYAHDAAYNQLAYNRAHEENMVSNVFRPAIMEEQFLLESQDRMPALFLQYARITPELEKHLNAGLETILNKLNRNNAPKYNNYQAPAWERIYSLHPDFAERVRAALANTEKSGSTGNCSLEGAVS